MPALAIPDLCPCGGHDASSQAGPTNLLLMLISLASGRSFDPDTWAGGRIGSLKDEILTPELIFQIHDRVSRDTLDNPSACGRLRTADEDVLVGDDEGRVFHRPPDAGELPSRLDRMCRFANGEPDGVFIHPVLRSIILHFWIGYDHPFLDGNGRCARALFYWSMLHHGYRLCEYVSISQILLEAPSEYGRSFLYTETDENDLTYFLTHRTSHNVVYQTARTDLLDLASRGILEAGKRGKRWVFTAPEDLEDRLTSEESKA